MAKYKTFDGNMGFHRVNNFRDYDITSLSLSGAILELKNPGDYDPTRYAFTIEFVFSDAKDAEVISGPDAGGATLLDGGRVFTDGSLTSIIYRNDLGDKIGELKAFDFDLPHLGFRYRDNPNLNRLYDAIVDENSRYNGTDEYDEIRTGQGNDKVSVGKGDDYILDRGGKDSYDGGKGEYDQVSYDEIFWNPHWGYKGVSVDLNAKKNKDFVSGFDGDKDSVKNIEWFRGTFRDDKFRGDGEDNGFRGLQGRDSFDGKGGFDQIRYDRDSWFGANDGIIADMRSGVARDGSGDFDNFKNIEGIVGTQFEDEFISAEIDGIYFAGREGEDTFRLHNGSGFINGGEDDDDFNFSGKEFYYQIGDFEFGADLIFVDDFDITQFSQGVSGDGDAVLVFDDGLGMTSEVELSGVTPGELANEIAEDGVESIVSFVAPGSLDLGDELEDEGGQKSEGKFKAEFKWFDGNQGFYRMSDFNEADITEIGFQAEIGGDGFKMENGGSYDPTQDWHTAIFGIKNEKWHSYETGEADTKDGWFDDGTYSAGSIHSVTYYNDLGQKIMEVTDLNVDLPWFAGYYAEEPELWGLWDAMIAYDATYIGSDDGSGPNTDWSGDDLRTGYGDDTVKANNGDDYITDFGGKDKYDGGIGYDTVSYTNTFWALQLAQGGINARLDKGYVKGPDGNRDKLKSIEEVRGTAQKDKFVGDGKDNTFEGRGGADSFDGKKGFDVVSYRNDYRDGGTQGIIADMQEGRVVDGFGKTDKLKNIEGIRGTAFDDSYNDSKGSDWFRAGDGEDVMVFRQGNDVAELDNDGDADLLIFGGDNFGFNDVYGFDDSIDKIDISNAAFSDLSLTLEGGNTLVEWNGNSILVYDVTLDGFDFV